MIGLVIVAVLAYWAVSTAYHRWQARRLGAESPPRAAIDHCFGFKNMYVLAKMADRGDYLEFGSQMVVDNPTRQTVRMKVSGADVIVTTDPENVKAILSTQFSEFGLGKRHAQFAPLLGDGVFTLDGDGWKHSRAMLRPQFARDQVSHVTMWEPHVERLVAQIRKVDGPVDLQPLFFKFAMDSATEFLFGKSLESLAEDDGSSSDFSGISSDFNYAQEQLAMRALMQDLYWVVDSKRFRAACGRIHEFADTYVDAVLALSPAELEKDSYTFLYELAKETRDPRVLRDQALNILIAGRDTTASTLSFLFFELARHPEVVERLRAEIAGLDELSFDRLKRAKYLQAVVSETLRLYPIVFENARFNRVATTLPRGGGDGSQPAYVPKGSNVTYSAYLMHRDPRYYGADAEVFDPSRWLDDRTKRLGWAYLPFNGGPRVCLGQQFALTQIAYVVERLLQEFATLQDASDGVYPPLKTLLLTMSLKHGCVVRV
ncbi:cytochrome P450 52A12 [Diutina catenulata]